MTTRSEQSAQTFFGLDDAMDIVFSKLDKGIDDLESGRVITSEELWSELEEV